MIGLRNILILCCVFLSLSLWATPHEEPPVSYTMPAWKAVVLGLVEGVTEFLPVSSTGHLLLAERAMSVSGDAESELAADTYMIVIQIGAILAVAWVYHDAVLQMWLGLWGRSPSGRRLLINLILGFLPAAIIGILFIDMIKAVLFGLWPVTIAWFAGGIGLLIWGKPMEASSEGQGLTINELTPVKALLIGVVQVLAMWPGTSRSLVTILAGRWVGLTLRDSVIFSFLLGLVTLSASTVYDFVRNGGEMIHTFGLNSLIIGMATAAISAWFAVKGMVGYLKKHGLGLFGWYRVAIATVTAILLLTGVLVS